MSALEPLRKAICTLEAAKECATRDAQLVMLRNLLARTEARTVKGTDTAGAVAAHERDALNLANAIIGATS